MFLIVLSEKELAPQYYKTRLVASFMFITDQIAVNISGKKKQIFLVLVFVCSFRQQHNIYITALVSCDSKVIFNSHLFG